MRTLRSACLLAVLAAPAACAPVNLELERERLLALQAQERSAHLNRDAGALVSMIADDFVSIEDGAVERPSRDTLRQRFKRYFSTVEFLEWADISPPVVTVDESGTMATIVVTKRVRLRPAAEPAAPAGESTFAWLEVWRKVEGEWRMAAIASTEAGR